ncbi:MAG: DNA polymerase IV [Firmicutes bacterium]|nr:DNA polymerase IV [Bacillota bacterium]
MPTQKIIAHVDVNNAFLSWTAAYRLQFLGETLDLRTIPAVIGGDSKTRHGIVLAKSEPAKAMGIKTGEPLYQARQKCPHLQVFPPDYALYVQASQTLIAFLKERAPMVEQYSIDEAWIDLSGTQRLYGPPLQAAYQIKNDIRERMGFTVNIGLSTNKILAKTAGDFAKPDLLHTLFPEEIPDKLWPLPVKKLFQVGPASEKKLQAMGIFTVGQLAHTDPARLRRALHKHGETLWRFANGYGEDTLTEQMPLNKGYSHAMTAAQDVTERREAHRILLSLCETAAMRMRQDKQYGGCVGVFLRSHDFRHFVRQQQLAQPSDSTLEIYRQACRIFDRLWDGTTPLRQLGVSISKVTAAPVRQMCLFEGQDYERLAKSDAAMDEIRRKFGEDAIFRACFLQSPVPSMGGGLSKERRTGVTGPLPQDPAAAWEQEKNPLPGKRSEQE